MRNYADELERRVDFIRNILKDAGAKGIVFGNSGGKDSALAGILCKRACSDTVGVIMPCGTKRNYGQDAEDALALAEQYGIETRTVDLSDVKNELEAQIKKAAVRGRELDMNVAIAPRLRMITLFSIASGESRLVAGTGNRSEIYMGYFTKWGDGAYDFNPIGDLTVSEIYEFLEFLQIPESIIKKAPSGGLFEGQTDEAEMGVSYASIDRYLLRGGAGGDCIAGDIPVGDIEIIERRHRMSEHKRRMPPVFGMDDKSAKT